MTDKAHELPNLPDVLNAALRSGVAHNNGAGGQYLLCATESQLLKFAAALGASRAQTDGTSAPTIAGALFDFMGFLTTHETRWKFSAYDNASPAVEALEEWAAKRGFSLDEANVSGWLTAATLGETK